MRFPLFLCVVLAGSAVSLSAAAAGGNASALAALRLLPKDKAAKLARIEARDGTPEPDRWYLLVQDPAAENGVHEFVVAGKEIIASRAISQFADSLKPEDVIGGAAVKIDSDRAAKIAREYAQANNATISRMNYELKKEGADAAPIWKVSCLDESGNQVGEITVTAGKGNVISHEGFAVTPPEPTPTPAVARKTAEPKKKSAPRFEVYADSQVAPGTGAPTAAPVADPDTLRGEDSDPRERRRYRNDDNRGSAVGNAARSVGRTIRRFMPF